MPRTPEPVDSWIPGTSPGMTCMPRHVVARAADIPPGSRKLVHVGERAIVVLNVKGELFALSDKCPHKGGSLSRGKLTGVVTSSEPGELRLLAARRDPALPLARLGVRRAHGPLLVRPQAHAADELRRHGGARRQAGRGALRGRDFPVAVEDDYVVVETKGEQGEAALRRRGGHGAMRSAYRALPPHGGRLDRQALRAPGEVELQRHELGCAGGEGSARTPWKQARRRRCSEPSVCHSRR